MKYPISKVPHFNLKSSNINKRVLIRAPQGIILPWLLSLREEGAAMWGPPPEGPEEGLNGRPAEGLGEGRNCADVPERKVGNRQGNIIALYASN